MIMAITEILWEGIINGCEVHLLRVDGKLVPELFWGEGLNGAWSRLSKKHSLYDAILRKAVSEKIDDGPKPINFKLSISCNGKPWAQGNGTVTCNPS